MSRKRFQLTKVIFDKGLLPYSPVLELINNFKSNMLLVRYQTSKRCSKSINLAVLLLTSGYINRV